MKQIKNKLSKEEIEDLIVESEKIKLTYPKGVNERKKIDKFIEDLKERLNGSKK